MTAANPRPKPVRNYQKHGLTPVRQALKRLGARGVIDSRTRYGRAVLSWQAEVISDLGGRENLSAAQLELIEKTTGTKVLLDACDAFIIGEAQVLNRRDRKLYPIVLQRMQLCDSLTRTLSLLGLERRVKEILTLKDYIVQKEGAYQA